MRNLGLLYDNGQGVAQDYVRREMTHSFWRVTMHTIDQPVKPSAIRTDSSVIIDRCLTLFCS